MSLSDRIRDIDSEASDWDAESKEGKCIFTEDVRDAVKELKKRIIEDCSKDTIWLSTPKKTGVLEIIDKIFGEKLTE